MKQDNEERAVDTVGRPKATKGPGGVKGGVVGKSKSIDSVGSTQGVGGGLRSENTQDEPVFHESAFRTDGKDKNFNKKAETGLPRQDSTYQNRDRSGSGLANDPTYQRNLPSYPTKGPKTKKSNTEDD